MLQRWVTRRALARLKAGHFVAKRKNKNCDEIATVSYAYTPNANAIFREMFMVKPAYILKIAPALAILVGFGTTMALAGPIEDRQAAMKQNGKSAGVLVPIFKGESPYDAAVVKTNAEIIKQDFVKAFASFPPGSDKGPPETYAKPEIWSDPEGFKAAQERALKAVDALAATTDEAGFKTAMAGLGDACGGCHTKYRRAKE
jgi:cytochrome c556